MHTSYTDSSDALTPTAIRADRAAERLDITWSDGHETSYDFGALRWMCPCAYCRGEAGLPGWLDASPTLSPDQTRLEDVSLVGSYAIAPTWGDGHHTGYYTFAALRAHCPCPACTAVRAVNGDPDRASPAGGPR